MGVFLKFAKNFKEKNQPSMGQCKTVFAALAGHGHSVLVGMCQGFSAVLLPQLTAPTSQLGPLSPDQASWIAALGVISNPIGALIGGLLADALGRKATLLSAAVPYLGGWLLIAFAPSLYCLGVGRLVTGLAVGMGSVSYVYVAEVSRASQRGSLAGCAPILVSLGVLAVYAPGASLPWRHVALLGAGASILVALALFLLPESPAWLASKGKHHEAIRAVEWLRCCTPEVAAKELEALGSDTTTENKKSLTWSEKLATALEPGVWKPFFLLLAFFALQEGAGIYVVLFYAVDVFRSLGPAVNEHVASVIMGVARLVMSFVGAALLARFGRRTLAAASAMGMAVAMSISCGYEISFDNVPIDLRSVAWLPAACVMLHVCASMIGMLQLPWLMTGELFPLRVRSAACGLVMASAHTFIFASVKTYPGLVTTFGVSAVMGLFAGCSLLAAIFALTLLPETKGRTLRQIEDHFNGCGDTQQNSTVVYAGSKNEVFTIEDTAVKLRKANFNFNIV